MGITGQERARLEAYCAKFRAQLIEVLHSKQTGHPGGSLSACEILTTLYFHQAHVDARAPRDPGRDRVVLSKGHAAPMLYIELAEKGFFPVGELQTLRDIDSRLQGHPNPLETPGVEIAAGPLGIGLSAALGMALGLALDKGGARVYAVVGDGETDEGTIWEAAMAAAKFNPGNLTAIIDWNRVQLDGTTDEIMPTRDLAAKFEAFGWRAIQVDGHDVGALCDAYDEAAATRDRPPVILAHTVKGKGVPFMEGKSAWHGAAIKDADYKEAMAALEAAKAPHAAEIAALEAERAALGAELGEAWPPAGGADGAGGAAAPGKAGGR